MSRLLATITVLNLLPSCGAAPGELEPPRPEKQCPLGSDFTLDQSLVTKCGGEAGVDVLTQSGSLEGRCYQDDRFLYVCKVSDALLECAKEPTKELRFTRDEVVCSPAVGTRKEVVPTGKRLAPHQVSVAIPENLCRKDVRWREFGEYLDSAVKKWLAEAPSAVSLSDGGSCYPVDFDASLAKPVLELGEGGGLDDAESGSCELTFEAVCVVRHGEPWSNLGKVEVELGPGNVYCNDNDMHGGRVIYDPILVKDWSSKARQEKGVECQAGRAAHIDVSVTERDPAVWRRHPDDPVVTTSSGDQCKALVWADCYAPVTKAH